MKIAFFETPNEDKSVLLDLIGKAMPGSELSFTEEKLTDKNTALAADAECISVFINSMVSQEIIDALPKLKFITTRSTGYDHIDVDYAASKGIVVSSVPAYGSRTVAEFAFALILALSRKIFPAYHHLREEDSFDLSNLMGFDLYGKTIGVIGTGKIGKNAIKIAKGFEMNVIAYDMFPDAAFATQVGYSYVDLSTLLMNADIITIHAPYTKETHHLINMKNMAVVKKGALLINTARGEIVETEAIVWALDQNILGGVGIDVLEGERFMKEEMSLLAEDASGKKAAKGDFKMLLESNALIHDRRVIATPHMAFCSKEAVGDILKTTTENIAAFAQGAPTNVVKK
jgi:D-lactate dehydrogenase